MADFLDGPLNVVALRVEKLAAKYVNTTTTICINMIWYDTIWYHKIWYIYIHTMHLYDFICINNTYSTASRPPNWPPKRLASAGSFFAGLLIWDAHLHLCAWNEGRKDRLRTRGSFTNIIANGWGGHMGTKQWPTKTQTNYLQNSLLRMLREPREKIKCNFRNHNVRG